MQFNEAAFAAKAQNFLADYLAGAGKRKVVIGLSGGIDSAVAFNLAVRAIGKENVIAVMLPNGTKGDEACEYGRLVASQMGVAPMVRNIESIIRLFAAINGCTGDRRRGNLAARSRMVVLYDIAADENALVLGTENKTEHCLGYFTKAGDEISDIELLRDLYKTQVRALARYLGVPQVIIDKPPTADLWDGQSDEGELGITYAQIDSVLEGLFDQGKSPEELVAQGLAAKDIDVVMTRMSNVAFKLQDTPYPRL